MLAYTNHKLTEPVDFMRLLRTSELDLLTLDSSMHASLAEIKKEALLIDKQVAQLIESNPAMAPRYRTQWRQAEAALEKRVLKLNMPEVSWQPDGLAAKT